MKNKLSIYKKQKHPFLHLKTSCIGNKQGYNTQINTNFYSVQRINVYKIQKDLSIRSQVIVWKPFCLQTDGDRHKVMTVPHMTFCCWWAKANRFTSTKKATPSFWEVKKLLNWFLRLHVCINNWGWIIYHGELDKLVGHYILFMWVLVSNCCLMPIQQFFSYIMACTS